MPNNRVRIPEVRSTDAYLSAVRDSGTGIKDKYRKNPLGLAELVGVKLPMKPVAKMIEMGVVTPEEASERFGPQYPGIRDLVKEACTLEIRSSVAVGPRGGGKSFGVSFIEFFLWMILDFDALNLAGSELQAGNVYNYLVGYVEQHKEFRSLLKGDMLASESTTKQNNWIRVLTASQKSVRSPHAGGSRVVNGNRVDRGGLLVIDEEAECEPDIVAAALPTINTARPSVNLRVSTFHNEGGSFAEVVDNAEDMGYKTYRWDVFDVCAGCSCVGDECESQEKCFREDHYEIIVDPDTGKEEKKLKHRAYCGGRAKYADGWVPIEEIEALWRRTRRNHEKFEIEQMGSRPSSKGYVIKDRVSFKENIKHDSDGSEEHLAGFPISICVDWGRIAAGLTVWEALPERKHLLVYAELIEDAGLQQIVSKIIEINNKWSPYVEELACDIGGGGNYLNPYMRDRGFAVRDVNFAEQKEAAVAAWNITSEAHELIIPDAYVDFIKQVDGWKRDKTGRIKKGNDHLCDSAICYFAKFIDELGTSTIRIVPKSFSALPSGKQVGMVPGDPSDVPRPGIQRFQKPIVVPIRSKR